MYKDKKAINSSKFVPLIKKIKVFNMDDIIKSVM